MNRIKNFEYGFYTNKSGIYLIPTIRLYYTDEFPIETGVDVSVCMVDFKWLFFSFGFKILF